MTSSVYIDSLHCQSLRIVTEPKIFSRESIGSHLNIELRTLSPCVHVFVLCFILLKHQCSVMHWTGYG